MNLTPANVRNAELRDDHRLISVPRHKTSHIHGSAVICCTQREFGWMKRYITLSSSLPGFRLAGTMTIASHFPGPIWSVFNSYFFLFSKAPRTVFFTAGGRPVDNMSRYTTRQLAAVGFPQLTLHRLRHCIASRAWSRLEPGDRSLLARHMSHSISTQERYYVRLGAPEAHLRARRLIDSLRD